MVTLLEGGNYLEAIGVVVAAIIGLPVGIWIERYRSKQERNIGRPGKEASFLDVMATALSDMVKDINEGRVPYRSGHQFAAMLDAFGKETENLLGKKQWSQIGMLRTLADEAENIDEYLHKYGENALHSPVVRGWLVNAEREIGEIRAEAENRRALS